MQIINTIVYVFWRSRILLTFGFTVRGERLDNRPRDPAVGSLQAEDVSYGRSRIVSTDESAQFLTGRHVRAVKNPRDLEFSHSCAAVALFLATVVGGDQDNCFFTNAGIFKGLEDQTDQAISLCDGLIILRCTMAMVMAGSVDVIKMDEGKFGPFVLQIGDCTFRRPHGPLGMLDNVRDFAIKQARKTLPIVKASDLGGWSLTA
jgi:hypothetical protein